MSKEHVETQRHLCTHCGEVVDARATYMWLQSGPAHGDWFLSNITCDVNPLHNIAIPSPPPMRSY